MTIGGNPEEIRRQARLMRRHADAVADSADKVERGHALPWRGRASERFRVLLASEGRNLERTRETVLHSADELDRLADVLEERQAAIRRAQAFVEDELERAKNTLGRFAGQVWDTLTGAEKQVEKAAREVVRIGSNLPMTGHPDWAKVARQLEKK